MAIRFAEVRLDAKQPFGLDVDKRHLMDGFKTRLSSCTVGGNSD